MDDPNSKAVIRQQNPREGDTVWDDYAKHYIYWNGTEWEPWLDADTPVIDQDGDA